jgi:hypothetical protein
VRAKIGACAERDLPIEKVIREEQKDFKRNKIICQDIQREFFGIGGYQKK